MLCPGFTVSRRNCFLVVEEISITTIYLQSFFSKPRGIPFSVARWQPKGYSYHTIALFVPYDEYGNAIRKIPPVEYLHKYCGVLKRNFDNINNLVTALKNDGRDFTFCCWCNRARQMQYDKLFCHTILIGYFIEKFFSGIEVVYWDGRDNPVWTREEFNSEMQKYFVL